MAIVSSINSRALNGAMGESPSPPFSEHQRATLVQIRILGFICEFRENFSNWGTLVMTSNTHLFRNFLSTKAFIVPALVSLSLLGPLSAAPAQSSDDVEALKAEIQVLKEGQRTMQRDLAIIKQLLQQRPQVQARAQPEPFRPTTMTVAGAPALGDLAAQVTLIEFTDYQCPYCRRHSTNTKPQLVKDYVETGKLKYVMREFPLEAIHPQAFRAAEAALCAGDQGKYWDMSARFFKDPRNLQPDDLMNHAEGLGLDKAAFTDCFDKATYAEQVRNDLKAGTAAGVRGTPSFLIGLTDPEDPTKVTATKMLRGAQSYQAFQQAIEELLAQSAKGS
jgi:protein-disulfide isomerase